MAAYCQPGSWRVFPRKQDKRHAYLSHQQIELLATAAKDRGTLIRFLCYTGLGRDEAAALHAQDVDLNRRGVSVVENAVRVGGRIIVGTSKSHHARRVLIPTSVVSELEQLTRGCSADVLVFGGGPHYPN